jgi:precorrin-2 methylase
MKIGRRLREVLNLLEEAKVIDRSVFVSHAGMENERVETNLRRLRGEDPQAGYLSIILAHAEEKGS